MNTLAYSSAISNLYSLFGSKSILDHKEFLLEERKGFEKYFLPQQLNLLGYALRYQEEKELKLSQDDITYLLERSKKEIKGLWSADNFYHYLRAIKAVGTGTFFCHEHIDFFLEHTDVNRHIEQYSIGSLAFLMPHVITPEHQRRLCDKIDFSKEKLTGTHFNSLLVLCVYKNTALTPLQINHIIHTSNLSYKNLSGEPAENIHIFFSALPALGSNFISLSFEQMDFLFRDTGIDFEEIERCESGVDKIIYIAEQLGRKNAFKILKIPDAEEVDPTRKMLAQKDVDRGVKGYNIFREEKLKQLRVEKERQKLEEQVLVVENKISLTSTLKDKLNKI